MSQCDSSSDFGYQGYIQDGISETEYTLVRIELHFKEKTDIRVGRILHDGLFPDRSVIPMK